MTKSELLYNNLKKRAISANPGDAFASFRSIMEQHAVSQSTVTKALQRLMEEGLIQKSDGRGLEISPQVLKHRAGTRPVLCLAVPQWQSDWYSIIEHHFVTQAEVLNYDIEVLHYDWRLKVPRQLPPWKIDALVVVTDAPALTPVELRILDKFGVPYALFGRDISGLAVNCLTSDDEYAGAQAAHHLYELGHRRMAVAISQPRSESVVDRIKGFRQFMELHGLDVEMIDCGIEGGDFAPRKVYEALSRRFAERRPEFTGLFTLCEDSSAAIYRVCAEQRISIPDDLSVVGIGESWRVEYMLPPLTTISRDVGELARETWGIFRSLKSGSAEFIHKQIKPRLVVRRSTAAPRA